MAGPFVVGRHRAVIGAPARQVFDYLADMTRHADWNGDEGFRVTARPDGPPAVGSVFAREKTGVMRGPMIIRGGMSDNMVRMAKTTAITAHEPYNSLVFETRNSYNGLLVSIDRVKFDLQQEAVGTRVTMLSEVEAMVPGGFMGPAYAIRLVSAIFERLIGERLSGLFPQAAVGPYLLRIRETVEAGDAPAEV